MNLRKVFFKVPLFLALFLFVAQPFAQGAANKQCPEPTESLDGTCKVGYYLKKNKFCNTGYQCIKPASSQSTNDSTEATSGEVFGTSDAGVDASKAEEALLNSEAPVSPDDPDASDATNSVLVYCNDSCEEGCTKGLYKTTGYCNVYKRFADGSCVDCAESVSAAAACTAYPQCD